MEFAERDNPASAIVNWEERFHLFAQRLFRFRRWMWLGVIVLGVIVYTWRHDVSHFVLVHADHEVSGTSAYPLAADPNLVGTYASLAKSGGGYFYDDVLEYRVWLHPENGAEKLNDDDDYYEAFAQYEKAAEFSRTTHGAEEPLVLVRQREWVNEPKPGSYVPEKGERIAEWQVRWLVGTKRNADSIQDFLKHPAPNRQ